MKIIFKYLFIIIFLSSIVLNKKICRKRNLEEYKLPKYLKFITGMGIGYGLNHEANEQLKNCFIQKSDSEKIVNKFFNKADHIKRKQETKLNSNVSYEKKEAANGFTKEVVDFFTNFKDCAPFRETFLQFVKTRIISITVKGLVYAAGGIIGLLLKASYDIYKLISEIQNFYNIRTNKPVDYLQLGSSVGKIVYFTQNLLIKRKFK
jgi:hypothetical protein